MFRFVASALVFVVLMVVPVVAETPVEQASPADMEANDVPTTLADPVGEFLQFVGGCGADGVCVPDDCLHVDSDCLCEPSIDCGQDSDCPANGYCYLECAVCYCT